MTSCPVCRLQESPGSFEVVVQAAMPADLVANAGAPAEIWYHIQSPASDDRLFFDVLWVNKTATRLPEVGLLRAASSQTCHLQRA